MFNSWGKIKELNNLLKQKVHVEYFNVNLEANQTYQNDILKKAKIVIVNWRNSRRVDHADFAHSVWI